MKNLKIFFWRLLRNNSNALVGVVPVLFTYFLMSTMESRKIIFFYIGFRDVSCFDDVQQWLVSNGNLIGEISMTIAFFSFLIILFTCCLCFHPEKKLQAGNFY
jgi:hypothetical protein